MPNEPKTPQDWAWDYLKWRLGAIMGQLELFENRPKIPTFADIKEGELFIRFPSFVVRDDKLIFANTELYRRIETTSHTHGRGGCYNAMKIIIGSLHEIPDNEPVIVVR